MSGCFIGINVKQVYAVLWLEGYRCLYEFTHIYKDIYTHINTQRCICKCIHTHTHICICDIVCFNKAIYMNTYTHIYL